LVPEAIRRAAAASTTGYISSVRLRHEPLPSCCLVWAQGYSQPVRAESCRDASGHNAIEINEWSTLGAEFGKLCHLHRADCGIVNHGMTSAIVMDAFLSRLVRWTTGWPFFGREEHEAQTRQQQLQGRPQSSFSSRFTAGTSGFFILSQSGERPDR
jgi:hypothetical protein